MTTLRIAGKFTDVQKPSKLTYLFNTPNAGPAV
jgi:hypothetical protein